MKQRRVPVLRIVNLILGLATLLFALWLHNQLAILGWFNFLVFASIDTIEEYKKQQDGK